MIIVGILVRIRLTLAVSLDNLLTMKYIKAILNGVQEFRSNSTTHYEEDLINYYDFGRELAHTVTFGQFES